MSTRVLVDAHPAKSPTAAIPAIKPIILLFNLHLQKKWNGHPA